MVVSYKIEGDSFTTDMPRPWSEDVFTDTGILPSFDVSPDGERVVALMPAGAPKEPQSANHVTFMLNFVDEVRRRLASQ
jgi:hypothetical protein